MNWQNIETAPKTSKAIIVYCAELKNMFIVTWRDFESLSAWNVFGSNDRLSFHNRPTHWMPLPDAPENNQPKGNENE